MIYLNIVACLIHLGQLVMDFVDGFLSFWSFEINLFGNEFTVADLFFGPQLIVVLQAVLFKFFKNLINPFT